MRNSAFGDKSWKDSRRSYDENPRLTKLWTDQDRRSAKLRWAVAWNSIRDPSGIAKSRSLYLRTATAAGFSGHSPQRCYNNAIMRRVKYVVNHTLVVEAIFVACTPERP